VKAYGSSRHAAPRSDDQHYQKCVATLREIKEPLATVWPALTEALYLLTDLPRGQDAVWDSILRGTIGILPLDAEDIPRIRELMRKYRDQGMDLADACVVRMSELMDDSMVYTVDKTYFSLYRRNTRQRIPCVFPD